MQVQLKDFCYLYLQKEAMIWAETWGREWIAWAIIAVEEDEMAWRGGAEKKHDRV